MRHLDTIIVTNTDRERLLRVVEQHDTPASERLANELDRATIVDVGAVPADVVTMNREVEYEDRETSVRRTVRVVYPNDANATKGWISVLAPIGAALLGLRVNQSIEWPVGTTTKRIRVVAIHGPDTAVLS